MSEDRLRDISLCVCECYHNSVRHPPISSHCTCSKWSLTVHFNPRFTPGLSDC